MITLRRLLSEGWDANKSKIFLIIIFLNFIIPCVIIIFLIIPCVIKIFLNILHVVIFLNINIMDLAEIIYYVFFDHLVIERIIFYLRHEPSPMTSDIKL